MIKPYYEEPGIQIFLEDCLEILPELPDKSVDLVLTDPPYPNNANHFTGDILRVRRFLGNAYDILFELKHWMVFWHELEIPPIQLPLVAKHIWHRTNTNRPDNYEAIYEFNLDGIKRASRVLPYAVIYPGLTGCYEATGHPTQKNTKLIRRLIEISETQDTILDLFMGSGTTLVAAKQLGRKAIGIEIERKYCDIAIKRLGQEVLQL